MKKPFEHTPKTGVGRPKKEKTYPAPACIQPDVNPVYMQANYQIFSELLNSSVKAPDEFETPQLAWDYYHQLAAGNEYLLIRKRQQLHYERALLIEKMRRNQALLRSIANVTSSAERIELEKDKIAFEITRTEMMGGKEFIDNLVQAQLESQKADQPKELTIYLKFYFK